MSEPPRRRWQPYHAPRYATAVGIVLLACAVACLWTLAYAIPERSVLLYSVSAASLLTGAGCGLYLSRGRSR